MPFLQANIDRAIVITQYNLRGYDHSSGAGKEVSAKWLDATTCNLACYAVGLNRKDDSKPTTLYADYFDSSFGEYLAMCKELAGDCDHYQKEAIQLIVRDIVGLSAEMKAELAAGTREPSPYLLPLAKNNRWGKAVLALAEAFEVSLEQASPSN